MYRKSIRNLISDMKPCESFDTMAQDELMMPIADLSCDLCGKCSESCPSNAISVKEDWTVDIGKCIFCMDCRDVCEHISGISTPHYVLNREDLIFHSSDKPRDEENRLPEETLKTLGKSISIRKVDAGSCGSCEMDINAISNKYYDMERFGIKIAASPRHADALMITGPMTRNMYIASMKTYSATPDPKIVIASGTCAISGGLFSKGDVIGEGIDDSIHVDVYIPGCPPSPARIVVSIIKAMGLNRH